MNRWIVTKLDGGLGQHAVEWDALRARLFDPNPMLDSRFVDALLRHFADGSEQLCVFRSGGVAQAMCLLRPGKPGIWTTFLPAQAQLGPVLLKRPELVGRLIRALPGVVLQLDFLCNDPAFGDLTGVEAPRSDSKDHALTMCIDLADGFDQYWSGRPRKLVQNLGRYERRLEADGIAVTMTCITDAAGMDTAVARYAQLETSGWKGKLGTAIEVDSRQGGFYRGVATRFGQSGEALVYELWLGDRLAASRLAIVAGQTMAMLKTTYDESLNKYAPGRLLLHRVIEDAFARWPGGVIEFYTDANADQLAWATAQRWIRHVSFYRTGLIVHLSNLAQAGRSAWRAAPPRDESGVSTGDSGVEVFAHPDAFPPDVQRFFTGAEVISVEFGVAWYRNLVNAVYQRHPGVRFYVLRRGGRPVAALPILAAEEPFGQRVESLSNYYTALYAPLVAPELKARDLLPLVFAVRKAHAPLSRIRLAPMDPQAHGYRVLLDALRLSGLVPFPFYCFGNWFLKVESDWPAYLAGRGGTLRNTIKRMGKKFAAEGGSLQLVQGVDEASAGLDAYERVYAASWKVAEPHVGFVPGLVQTCAERGWLRLGVAWLKDVPIAAQIWMVADGKAYIYKVAYHEDYKAFAPGTLLTSMLMQHAIETDSVREVDYLIGDDPYKKTWMSDRRERWGLVAYNPGSIRGLAGLAIEVAGRTVKSLRSRFQRRVAAGG